MYFQAYNSTSISSTTQLPVPHAFQISMPPQVQLPHASILEKSAASLSPVLPISTGTLFSSVPSPVYSALEKSPTSKNIAEGIIFVLRLSFVNVFKSKECVDV
jgi:hypothetical protein